MTSASSPVRSLLSRCLHVVVALALVLPVLVLIGLASPAEAVAPSCPAAGITVTSLNSPNFYVDSGVAPKLLSGYAGYRVTSTDARSDLWVKLSNFTGGALALNSSQPGRLPLGAVTANGSVPAYFMLTANPAASASFGNVQNHTVEVYSGIPGTSTATVLCSTTGSFSKVSETIKAAANKLQAWSGGSSAMTVTSSTSTPKLGGTVTVSVEGNTGTIGAGISNDPNGFNMTPSALASFPAGAFRLVSTSLLISPTGSGAKTTYNDVLHLALTNGTARDYRTTYVFALTGTTTTGTQLYPVQQIASGTQIKHTDTSSYSATIPPIAPVSNTVTIDLVADPTSLPDWGGNATMTQTLNSTTTNPVIVDQLLAELPGWVSYVPGTAAFNGAAIADPDITGQELAFSGPFPASTSTPGVLTYTLNFPDFPSSWVIKGWGLLGNTYIDTTTATIDVAPAEAVIPPASYASQTITFPALTDSTISGAQPVPAATASSGLTVTYETTTPAVCTISGTTITVVGAGVCTVRARQEGDGSNAAANPVNQSYTIAGDTQTITFPPMTDTSGDQTPPTPAATTTSGLPITYTSSTPSVCTIGEGVIFFTGTGTCTIEASQPGGGNYAPGTPASRSFTVTAGSQTITFPALPDTAVDQTAPTPDATASSGLPVSYTSSTTSVCTVTSAGVITLVAPGTCTISAAQGGSSTYDAATSVSRSFAVTKVSQSITFPAPPDTAVDDPTAPTMSATASSGLPVSYTSSTTSVCTVTSGGVVALVSPGTCTITAAQAGSGTYAAATSVSRSFTIAKAFQLIDFPGLADTEYGTAAPVPAATSDSELTVTYTSTTPSVCTVTSAGVISLVGLGACQIQADQTGNGYYDAAASELESFQVQSGTQTITFPALADTAVNGTAPTPAATSSSDLTVDYASSTTSVCTVTAGVITLVAPGTCTITASQDGNSNYSAASSVDRSFAVTKAGQTINFPTLPDTAYDGTPPSPAATSSSGQPVTYTSDTTSICTISGGVITLVDTGTCSITASQEGNSTYNAATSVTRSFEVTQLSQTISFPTLANTPVNGTAPEPNATASSTLPVTYTSATPAVCTISGGVITLVSAGTCTIIADQEGNDTYAAASPVSRSFVVAAVPAAPAPGDVTSTGPVGAVQHQTLTPPSGGSVYLVDRLTLEPIASDTVTVAGEGVYTVNRSTGLLTFTPEVDFYGTATAVSVAVQDSLDQVGYGTYTATVTLPAAPVARPKSSSGTTGQTQRATVAVPTGGSMSLWDGTSPVTSITVPEQGTYRVDGSELVFEPLADFVGTAAPVAYQVTDRFDQIGRSTYQATVNAPGGTPAGSASPTTATVNKGVPITLSPLNRVVAPAGERVRVGTLRIGTSPKTSTRLLLRTRAGQWRVNGQGRVRFTPVSTFVGVSTIYFQVTASDGSVLRSSMSVVVTGTVSGTLRATVYFGERSARLDSHDRQVLRRVAARVPARATTSALAVGYVQPERYRANDARLSRARGRNVARAMQRMVALQKVVIAGHGRARQKDWRARRATVTLKWSVTQR